MSTLKWGGVNKLFLHTYKTVAIIREKVVA